MNHVDLSKDSTGSLNPGLSQLTPPQASGTSSGAQQIHSIQPLQTLSKEVLDSYLTPLPSSGRKKTFGCTIPECDSKPLSPLSLARTHVRRHLQSKTHECIQWWVYLLASIPFSDIHL